jgi:hypothetical protein
MGPLIAEEGKLYISNDLGSAEPNVLLNLTDDTTLNSILNEMTGVRPFYDSRGVLMTNSLYITTMSKTPLLKPSLDSLGEAWLDLYAADNDAAKDQLGQGYKLSKSLCLGMVYGMGAAKLGRILGEARVILRDVEHKAIVNEFWDTLPDVRDFRDAVVAIFKKAKKKGEPFVNPFGFPLPTGKPKDAMNLIIQSSVSCWVRHLNSILYRDERFELIGVIHDELVTQVNEEYVEDYRKALKDAIDETNHKFQLKYPLGMGWKTANSFAGFK